MAKVKFNRNFSIGRVVAKLVAVTLALYVGNTIMNVLGSVMNETQGPFNLGFKMIGWTVGTTPQVNATNWYSDCAGTVDAGLTSAPAVTDCITGVSGTGILAVIGLVGIASIVMEFVEFRMG